MPTLTITLDFVTLLLFLAVVYIQTLRNPPPAQVRPNWPLRHFWVGDRLRHLALILAGITALLGLASAVVHGVGTGAFGHWRALFGAALALAVIAASSLFYSVALYWQPSVPKAEGF